MPMYLDDEHAVIDRSRKLARRARRWGVAIPKEWCVPDSSGVYYVGSVFHDALETKIRTARRTMLFFQGAALLGVSATIANLVRGRRSGH
jgi:hypothetical protein